VEEAREAEEPVPFVRTEPFSLVSAEDRARLPDDVEDAYPLARLQAGMLLHMELTPERPLYHNVDTSTLRRPFRREALEEALRRVVARHPVLRTGFHLHGFSEPLQLVRREARPRLTVEDLRHLPLEEQAAAVRARMEMEIHEPFDLTRPPLLRFHVQLLDEERFQLTLVECHAIFDGWSLTTTLGEIFGIYGALLRGENPPEEPPPSVSYRDFVALERRTLESPACREWWERKLAGVLPERLPRLARGVPGERRRVVRRIVDLPEGVVEGMRRLEEAASVPRKTVCLTAHLRVMSLLSGSPEVLTGVTANGRPETADGERVRGLFLNTVPFRHRLPKGSWTEVARSVFAAEREVLPFRRYPLAAIQEARRGGPLVESSFNYVHFHGLHDALRAERMTGMAVEEHADTNFTLLAHFGVRMGGRMHLVVVGDASVLGDELVEALPGCYLAVLRAMAEDPAGRADEVDLLGPDERARLREEWDASARDRPAYPLVHEMVAEHAARAPDAPAVVSRAGALSYGALDAYAARLAGRLRGLGAGPERRVALLLERSPELVVAALATLRAGAAYLPVDPAYPPERIAWMLGDSGAAAVLTVDRLADRVPRFGGPVVRLDRDEEDPAEAGELPAPRPDPENAAYVIYTSGSTGMPKGVVVTHAALGNLVRWHLRASALTPADRVLMVVGPGFDGSVLDLWPCLAAGASLHPVEDEEVRAFPGRLRDFLLERGITVAAAPTPFVERLLTLEWPTDGPLRRLLTGGDVLRVRPPRGLPFVLADLYGPTETAVVATSGAVEPGEPGSRPADIGRAIDNVRAYVLDAGLRPLPYGAPGELYVGGAGVARGYLGRPDLTAERFLPDPFSPAPGARMYRTGDRGRRLADGTLEFLGRVDHQVKVRGFRVELGEVEAALAALPGVREGAVVARPDGSGEVRLVGYVAAAGGTPPDPVELRGRLMDRLPDYMVPSPLVVLDRMPLTPNGKVDRDALPDPEDTGGRRAFVAPRTPTEERLARIWVEVLGVERVGAEDHFFELGGHSLLATQLVSRVREAFRVELPLRAVFEAPVLAELARRMEALRGEAPPADEVPPLSLVPGDAGVARPLSFAQQRLWFLDRLQPGSTAYNMLLALRLRGALDPRVLERTLAEVVRRHEALRTTFGEHAGAPVQVIHPVAGVSLPVPDLSGIPAEAREAEALRIVADEGRLPFDLECGPLLRVRLVRLAERDHVLVLALHHIVSDGWSMGVLFREVAALYEAFSRGEPSPLSDLPLQYADFAAWQRERLRGEALERETAWWRERLAGAPPVLEIPTDHPRRPMPGERGTLVTRLLPGGTLERLRLLARSEGATLFMVLLGALNVLLARWSGQEDVVVGSPIAGRNRRETEGLVGFFVNTLALRVDVSGNPAFRELLGRVREATLEAYQHQELPFEKLVEELDVERSLSHSPVFQVLLLLNDGDMSPRPFGGIEVKQFGSGPPSAKLDLALSVAETEGGLGVGLVYREELWDASTLERAADAYALLLETIAADPARRVLDLPLAGRTERVRVLREWSPGPEAS
ncbi:MAG TPA: amino acid adenylation domain-containing protein, partial [Longimicrobiaceae bacterium]|nr:amino acid adenylation domain-containing protein [Longimicrobiaceae bacterium]